ncbi:MAG TPA: hypothetical protein VHV82_04845 [Sporichthyaceae bacterium]|jgi:hypothetical protein|nr:hypothetical protein [Sporichthyaceae bacterium]
MWSRTSVGVRGFGLAASVLAMPLVGLTTASPVAAGTTGPDPTSVSLQMLPQRPETPGEGFGVWGNVTDTANTADQVSGTVAIFATYPDSTAPALVATTSVAEFVFGVSVPQAARATYTAQYTGNADFAASASGQVVGTLTGQVVATPEKTLVKRGHAVRVDVEQLPAQPGTPVILQEFKDKRWTTIAGATLNGGGHAHFWVKSVRAGRHLYRALWPGDAVAGGNSGGTVVITAT